MRAHICHFHPPNPISHFCISPTCTLPMCLQCIPIHQQQHTPTECHQYIIEYGKALEMAKIGLRGRVENCVKEDGEIRRWVQAWRSRILGLLAQIGRGWGDHLGELREKLQQVQNGTLKGVIYYFGELQRNPSKNYQQQIAILQKIQQSITQLISTQNQKPIHQPPTTTIRFHSEPATTRHPHPSPQPFPQHKLITHQPAIIGTTPPRISSSSSILNSNIVMGTGGGGNGGAGGAVNSLRARRSDSKLKIDVYSRKNMVKSLCQRDGDLQYLPQTYGGDDVQNRGKIQNTKNVTDSLLHTKYQGEAYKKPLEVADLNVEESAPYTAALLLKYTTPNSKPEPQPNQQILSLSKQILSPQRIRKVLQQRLSQRSKQISRQKSASRPQSKPLQPHQPSTPIQQQPPHPPLTRNIITAQPSQHYKY